jgi:hypothetical protein
MLPPEGDAWDGRAAGAGPRETTMTGVTPCGQGATGNRQRVALNTSHNRQDLFK